MNKQIELFRDKLIQLNFYYLITNEKLMNLQDSFKPSLFVSSRSKKEDSLVIIKQIMKN